MEIALVFVAIACGIIGLTVGLVIGRNRKAKDETRGILHVDSSESANSPGLYLTLTVPIDDVVSRKHVLFDVNVIQ